MVSRKLILQIVIALVSVFFTYLLFFIRTSPLTTGEQNFTSVSSCIVSDGASVWIANMIQNGVSKFDLNGKAITSFYSGKGPKEVLLVGNFIWVSNYYDNTVSKIDSNSGAISGVIEVGSGPSGLAFDGANIWVTNYGNATCSIIGQGSMSLVETLNVGKGPTCVLFDGTNIWITCAVSSEVYVFNPSTLSLINRFSVGSVPFRMSYSNNVVYVLDASSQSSLYSVGTSGVADVYTPQIGNCVDITTDGKNFFTASQLGDIFKFNTTNNTVKSFNSGIQANSIQIINNKIYVFAQTLNTGSIFDIDGFNLLYNINFS